MSGYEGNRIPEGGEHPNSWGHPKIVDAFDPLDTTDAHNQAEKYWQVHGLWEQGVETFARSITTSIAQAWSGPAADTAKAKILEYTKDAQTLTPALAELYSRVQEAANSIAATKRAIPTDPVIITWTSWAWPPNRWELQDKQSKVTQEARDAMLLHYVTPFSTMDGKIPELPTPTNPANPVDIPTPSHGGYPANNGGGSNQPGTPSSAGTPGDTDGDGTPDEPTSDQPKTEEPQSKTEDEASTETTPAANSTGTNPAATDPSKTTPAGTGGPSTGGAGSGGAGSGGAGSGGAGSAGGAGGSGSQQSTGGPGRTIAGTPATPVTSGSAATTAAAGGAAGRRTPGMMSPGAAGRGGNSDDESAHKIPDYLITQENTDELLGAEPTTVRDGVIGGENQG